MQNQPQASRLPSRPARPSLLPEKPATLLPGLLLFGATVWTFFPALQNGFINYDDPDYITDNVHVRRGLSWESVRWALTDTQQAGFWHPLTWLSHMLDCEWFGLHAWGHHLTSVLLHALNVALVFLVFREMTGARWRSFLLAALFGLHPLRVESVAWAAERKDVLGASFWMFTLWMYVRYAAASKTRSPKSKAWYAGALVLFALGLMTKPMLVTLPGVLLLLDYWPLQRFRDSTLHSRLSTASLLLEKVPFVLAAMGAGAAAFLTQRAAGATAAGVPGLARVENAVVSYGRYLGKTVWPMKLAVFYPHPGYWPTGTVLACSILLLGISVFAVAFRRERPWLLTGWLWFLGTLVPVIGLVQVGEQSMADRFSYLPCVGVLVMLIWGAGERVRPRPVPAAALAVAALASALACASVTRRQIRFWKDSETLFEHALAVTQNNHVAHFCLGVALENQGRTGEAGLEYQAALALKPDYAPAHNNLGFALSNLGRFDQAMAELQEAMRLKADPARVHFGMGIVFGRQGKLGDAIAQFEEAVKLRPDWPVARYNLGIAFGREGNMNQAIVELQRAVDLEPDSGEFRFNLGIALARANRQAEAIEQYQKSLSLRPGAIECRVNLANALARSGRLTEAIEEFRKALQQKPDLAEAHYNFGLALQMNGQTNAAAGEFRQALRLNPGYREAQRRLSGISSAPATSEPPVAQP